MRIIAGKFGGRKLKVFPAKQMRPTTDRVREAIFSSLQTALELGSCIAVDLYAGTGSMGLEALSRGVDTVVFVEQDKRLCSALRENAEMLGISSGLHIVNASIPAALKHVSGIIGEDSRPRLFLIDPPYTAHPGVKIVEQLLEAELITDASFVVLGAPKGLDLDFSTQELSVLKPATMHSRHKAYGDTIIHFLSFG